MTGLKTMGSVKSAPKSGAIFCGFDKKSLAFIVTALFFLTAPLDLPQLVCGFIGAIVYASLQLLPNLQRPRAKQADTKSAAKYIPSAKDTNHGCRATASYSLPSLASRTPAANTNSRHASPPGPKPTAMPIEAPTFKAGEFNSQVDELVERITPTPACDQTVKELTEIVKKAIQSLIPEIEVCGFASGNLGGGMAYGVAVPEVDIVANACPAVLTKRLQGRLSQNARQREFSINRLDARKLQKSSIRVCTSLLVSVGLKFRRSSFRSQEPKVTLLAPQSLGVSDKSVPIDFSMNNITPLYNMALFTECGQMEPRAKSLILLVKRWAKDRGVCHASKGHLPPYAWSLLVIYFLQVGVPEEGPLLPPLEGFAVSSGLMSKPLGAQEAPRTNWTPPTVKQTPKDTSDETRSKKAVGELFQQFVRFYTEEIDWRKEAVSVRLGKRVPPNLALDIHIVLNGDGSTAVSPIIEDPFDNRQNLGACMNAASLQRFDEELTRARDLMSRGISLTELLQPWRPTESEQIAENQDQDNDDEF